MLEEAFLQAIAEHSEDDHYRLVYADWLEEQGDPRAQLVRISHGVPRCEAIISDIHGNLEALEAVLRDIASWNVREIYCLGDMVGYGPNPRECVDLTRTLKLTLMGNHDEFAWHDPEGHSPTGDHSLFWIRSQLDQPSEAPEYRQRRWDFISGLPRSHTEDDFLFVHGSPRNPINEYLFPEDIDNLRKMQRNFEQVRRYCFHGHTHLPGILTDWPRQFHRPADFNSVFHLDQRKALVNVGSVGQPRDGDWRACYVLLVGTTVHYRRVEYDVEATIRKIYAIPELENFLGDRLRDGR